MAMTKRALILRNISEINIEDVRTAIDLSGIPADVQPAPQEFLTLKGLLSRGPLDTDHDQILELFKSATVRDFMHAKILATTGNFVIYYQNAVGSQSNVKYIVDKLNEVTRVPRFDLMYLGGGTDLNHETLAAIAGNLNKNKHKFGAVILGRGVSAEDSALYQPLLGMNGVIRCSLEPSGSNHFRETMEYMSGRSGDFYKHEDIAHKPSDDFAEATAFNALFKTSQALSTVTQVKLEADVRDLRAALPGPADKMSKEEYAIQHQLELLAHSLSRDSQPPQPPKSKFQQMKDMLVGRSSTRSQDHHAVIPLSRLSSAMMDIARNGHFSLIAKSINENYLGMIEEIIKVSTVVFVDSSGEPQPIQALYEACLAEGGPFTDILLRMYTQDGPFFRQLNAILGGYNTTATPDEVVFSALFIVAIHKAGLEKSQQELHVIPETLYRAETFGLDAILEKLEQVKTWCAEEKLTTLTPDELMNISIADLVGKKCLSTTAIERVASNFLPEEHRKTGFILCLRNPTEFAKFYSVGNCSAIEGEDEYITRLPDDIAIIPVDAQVGDDGIIRVDVLCIRSEDLALRNSGAYDRIKIELLDLLANARCDEGFSHLHQSTFTQLYKQLVTGEQAALISGEPFKLIALLYDPDILRQDKGQKEKIDAIKNKLDELGAVALELNVLHTQPDDKSALIKLQTCLSGIKAWYDKPAVKLDASLNNLIGRHKVEFDVLVEENGSTLAVHACAQIILEDIPPAEMAGLRSSLLDIIHAAEIIHPELKVVTENHAAAAPSMGRGGGAR